MKFTINEVKIEDFQDTHDSLNTFSEGLNVIFGENEIGKSTLMNFITRILTKDSDAKGYIKCSEGKKPYKLNAEKKAKKDNKYPDKLNAHDYKEGFVITLDDIVYASKKDAQSLVDLIKDSSGEGVKEKEKELYEYIDSYIKMKSKNASTKLTPYFNKIIDLDAKIKQLQQNEEDYNNVCIKSDNLNKEISKLKEKQKVAELVLRKNELSKNISNISVNENIIKNKDLFEKIRNDYAVLAGEISDKNKLEEEIENKKNEYQQIKKELDKLEFFDEEEINNFVSDKDNIKLAQEIIYTENDVQKKETDLLNDIKNIDKELAGNDTEKSIKEEKLQKIGIQNFDEYCSDIAQLESNKTTYGELIDKSRQNDVITSKNDYISVIIWSLLCAASVGMLFTQPTIVMKSISIIFIVVTVAGIISEILHSKRRDKAKEKLNYSEEIDKLIKDSAELCNKYGFVIDKTEFLSRLGKQIIIMNNNKNKYDSIQKEIENIEQTVTKLSGEKTEKENSLNVLKQKKEENLSIKEKFLTENNIRNIENYSDIFDKISELKEISKKIIKDNDSIEQIQKNKETFVQNLNNFIEKSELTNVDKVTKYDKDFSEAVEKIKEILAEEIKKETMADSYTKEIKEIENNSNYKEFIKSDEKLPELEEINQTIEQKTLEIGSTNQRKKELEEVSGLIDLKNKKNIAVNEAKEFLKTLVEKEVLYNIILAAKEKYNEIQPNLISAKDYLAKITNGKYSEIDFENKTISGKDVGEKDWDKLSRGTKEQLYLALRLGFAHNFSKDKDGNPNDVPDMPLIIDDAFVNFDKDRTCAILKCLEKISDNNQVLFFTCHTEAIKDLLKKEKIEYKEINLKH